MYALDPLMRMAGAGGRLPGVMLLVLAAAADLVPGTPADVGRQAAVAPVERAAGPAPAAPPRLTQAPADLMATGPVARQRNLALPVRVAGIEAPPHFTGKVFDGASAARARTCLALAMYYEAGFEGEEGRLAVGQVVLNRVRHAAFPHEVCAVVFERSEGGTCQFTFACDGAMARPQQPAIWRRTLAEATGLLAGKASGKVGMATHYHADYVFPYWAPRLDKIATIGTHIFYRWPGSWGRRSAFTYRYAGTESVAIPDAGSEAVQLAGAPADGPAAIAGGEVAPRRSEREGGFVDTSKGWQPRISQTAAPLDGDRVALADSPDGH